MELCIFLAVLVVIISLAIILLHYRISRDRRNVARQLRDCIEMRSEDVSSVNEAKGMVNDNKDTSIDKSKVLDIVKVITPKKVNYNSCVMIKRGWKDYRYLDKLLDDGGQLFAGKVLYIYVSGINNEIIMNPNISHYDHLFYINADRLKRMDSSIYEELLKVHESYTYRHSQHQLEVIHRFFSKLTYTGVEDIDNLISRGRSRSITT